MRLERKEKKSLKRCWGNNDSLERISITYPFMKIGILTFHCAHNYGAVLQCYALQEVLKGMGQAVEVIDYRPNYLTRAYRIISLHRILSRNPFNIVKRIISECLCLPQQIKRYGRFERFINRYLNLSVDKVAFSNYDIYVMGSDQIWNPKITKGFDGYYFGYFPFSKGERKYIAYAASMETEALSESEKEYLRKALCNFDAISVRETHLANLLRPLTYKNIQVVLDPTLLAATSIWNKFMDKSPLNKKYVLIYQVRGDRRIVKKIADHIAEQLGTSVVTIAVLPTWYRGKYLLQTESPQDFVNWFQHASCIVSSSFHGTAFSIIFNKPFYSVRMGIRDTREISLLRSLGLENRMIEKNSLPTFQNIDYNDINDKLDEYRNESICFLKSSLKHS